MDDVRLIMHNPTGWQGAVAAAARRAKTWGFTTTGCFTKVLAVPNVSKSSAQSPSARASLPFEEALKRLEAVVEEMESDELALETLIAKYEEGTKLAKLCQDKLAEAEVKISALEKTAEGEFRLKPLGNPAEV